MQYMIRAMQLADVPQVIGIDRECFPTQWPPPPYKKDLTSNELAHYLVACNIDGGEAFTPQPPAAASERRMPDEGIHQGREHIEGVIGLWLMAGEAHITTIAVRRTCRRRGLGESLLICAIDLAREMAARAVTLEVRLSNTEAQSLYQKYGFERCGVRRKYYGDNGEDAVIMTTPPLTSPAFQGRFRRLKLEHVEGRRPQPCRTGEYN